MGAVGSGSWVPVANINLHGRAQHKRGTERPRKTWMTKIAYWTRLPMIDAIKGAQRRKEWGRQAKPLQGHLRPPKDNDDDEGNQGSQKWAISELLFVSVSK